MVNHAPRADMAFAVLRCTMPADRAGDDGMATGQADARTASGRLVSLDVLRGLAVMGMILVNSAAGVFYGEKAVVFPTLLHASWDGLTLADTVFPAFLMMVGVAIPMASRAPGGAGVDGLAARRIGGRTVRLFAIGFILSNLYWFADFDSGQWRLWGVLQRIALAYGACALLFLAVGTRVRLVIAAAILVLYWPLTLLPALDGLPNDLWERGHNFVASVDRVLLGGGGHNYVRGPAGYDPEGLLGTLPAIAHGLIGVAIGEFLLARRGGRATLPLAGAGVAMLMAGLAWSFVFPVVKDIWSSSFVLVTCGATTLALALLHPLFDGRSGAAERWPWRIALAFGSNAIAAYVLHSVTGSLLGWDLMLAPYRHALGVVPPAVASLVPVLIYMALIGLAMTWLRRRGWYVKV